MSMVVVAFGLGEMIGIAFSTPEDSKVSKDDSAGLLIPDFAVLVVSAAEDERDRGEDVEPDRHPLAPVERVGDEVRHDHDEAGDHGDQERYVPFHAPGSFTSRPCS